MDIVNEVADKITQEILPHVSKQMNCCYLISMTFLACKTEGYEWHKKNWFLSYFRALVYGFGCDIILALLLGNSSLEAMSVNRSLLLIALAWWLINFMPYDVFNKFVHFKIGDNIRPLYLIMILFATARRMVKAQLAVSACLTAYPGSFIAILAGTIVSNGTLLLEGIFGQFAANLSNVTTARLGLTASILFTLVQTGTVTCISMSVALAFMVIFACIVESLEACDNHFRGFDYIHDALGKIIATKDLVGKK